GLSTRGVYYLDGGWQSLVDQVERLADAAGVRRRRATVTRVALDEGRAVGVDLAGDVPPIGAEVVVLALPLAEAARLCPQSGTIASAAARATPVTASCLDLVVESLPRPERRIAIGLDTPTYFSVHSAAARLVEPPAAVV